MRGGKNIDKWLIFDNESFEDQCAFEEDNVKDVFDWDE